MLNLFGIRKSWWMVLSFLVAGVVIASGQLCLAVAVQPPTPNFAWLFDGNDSAYLGGVDGFRDGVGGPNPLGPVFTNDVPLYYEGNQSLSYDGVNDRFVIPDSPALRPNNGAWTSAFWFKSPDSNQFGPMVQKRFEGPGFNQWSVVQGTITPGGTATASKKLSILLRNTSGQNWWYHTVDDIVDGDWHQVTFARDASGLANMYVDGVLKSLTLVSMTGTQPLNIDNTQPWTLGWNNGSVFYTGLIDEVAFWNQALNGSHAEWLATNSLLPPPAPEPSSLLLLAAGCAIIKLRRRKK